jgi:hypothetical protein
MEDSRLIAFGVEDATDGGDGGSVHRFRWLLMESNALQGGI